MLSNESTTQALTIRRGDEAIIKITQHVEEIGVSSIVIGELLSGFDSGSKTV